ncbi:MULTISPECIES: NAD(P)-dependent oxidoreductase [Actibacterium]|uniref:3-hydroxyisobutyrate dehydrogenase n=1 Tax=Actibacterium naphthalenivorans TaxID=1614693 RepID=A0A840CFW1_9RHOB|nr:MULTISPECIES: NAD(P)-dependent oxidoreductase [Actibacterium]ALG91677.1 oxidoreductase [Actibacterium sp. EMB200-NS6]MBB4021676.1 3-hydroxyisobutyrate dehydrogenase [Actibacterium naphthalenivorans]
MKNAGVIGLGMIGGGVAVCLARTGQLAAVYDIRPDAADALEGVPAVVASPAELAKVSDTILVAVVSAQQVIDVLSGPDGVLTHARPEMTIVVLATVSLTELERIRAVTDAAGVGLVDAGVTGGLKAKEGGLVSMVGGDAAVVERIMPVLNGFSQHVARMGDSGAGMTAKIARNVVVYGTYRAGQEAAALCRAAGVDIAVLTKVIDESAEGVGGPMMLANRADPMTDETEFRIRQGMKQLMLKDLQAAKDMAGDTGIELPLVDLNITDADTLVGTKKP